MHPPETVGARKILLAPLFDARLHIISPIVKEAKEREVREFGQPWERAGQDRKEWERSERERKKYITLWERAEQEAQLIDEPMPIAIDEATDDGEGEHDRTSLQDVLEHCLIPLATGRTSPVPQLVLESAAAIACCLCHSSDTSQIAYTNAQTWHLGDKDRKGAEVQQSIHEALCASLPAEFTAHIPKPIVQPTARRLYEELRALQQIARAQSCNTLLTIAPHHRRLRTEIVAREVTHAFPGSPVEIIVQEAGQIWDQLKRRLEAKTGTGSIRFVMEFHDAIDLSETWRESKTPDRSRKDEARLTIFAKIRQWGRWLGIRPEGKLGQWVDPEQKILRTLEKPGLMGAIQRRKMAEYWLTKYGFSMP